MYQTTLKHFENKLKEKFFNDDLTVLLFTKANAPVEIRCNKCNHIYNRIDQILAAELMSGGDINE